MNIFVCHIKPHFSKCAYLLFGNRNCILHSLIINRIRYKNFWIFLFVILANNFLFFYANAGLIGFIIYCAFLLCMNEYIYFDVFYFLSLHLYFYDYFSKSKTKS